MLVFDMSDATGLDGGTNGVNQREKVGASQT
jgi:hypothetical protein